MKEKSEPDMNSKTLIQKIISRLIATRFVGWLFNTRLFAFIIKFVFLVLFKRSTLSKKKVTSANPIHDDTWTAKAQQTRPISPVGNELDIELMRIAKDIVHELGYAAAMLASYEQGDVLPVRAFYIDPEIATMSTIKQWEVEIRKYLSKPINILEPDVVKVYRYKAEYKENLSIRAIELGQHQTTNEIYDLLRPMMPEASRTLINTAQKAYGINQLIAVPFFINTVSDGKFVREVVGNLVVATKAVTFEQEEIKILTIIGEQAASLIDGIYRQRRDKLVRSLLLTMQANLSNENILLQRIAESLVKEFGYAGAMVAPYEKGGLLPVRAFFVNEEITTLEAIAKWEVEVGKYSPKPVSLTNPEIARVNRYNDEDKENLSIRAIEAEKPMQTYEIYDLFRPIAPKATREMINAIQKGIGIQKLIAVPFFLEKEENGKVTKEVLGNLFTATCSKSFSAGEIEFFKVLGQQAAAGIRNARILKYANERTVAAQNFAKMAFTATASLHELKNHLTVFQLHLQLLDSYAKELNIDNTEKLTETKILDIKKRLEKNSEIFTRVAEARTILETLHEPWKREEEKLTDVNQCLYRALKKVFPSSSTSPNDDQRFIKCKIGVDDIFVSQNISKKIPFIHISDNMLTEAFRIIIKNTVDSLLNGTLNEKRIWLESSLSDDEFIDITIRSNEVGIATENIEKIFEYGSSAKIETGLGLYWTKEFIEGIGGNISVSYVLQQGKIFAMKIPCKSITKIIITGQYQ